MSDSTVRIPAAQVARILQRTTELDARNEAEVEEAGNRERTETTISNVTAMSGRTVEM